MSIDIVDLPVVTRKQMAELKQLMIEEFGISRNRIIVKMSRRIAQFSSSMLKENLNQKLICMLLGSDEVGISASIASGDLAKKGAIVYLISVERRKSQYLTRAIKYNQIQNLFAGLSHLVLAQLKSTLWDLVINASGQGICSYSCTDWEKQLVQIVNEMECPVLSIDSPGDRNHASEKNPLRTIRPTITLCFGLPLKELMVSGSFDRAGELYLADLAIPEGLLNKMGLSIGPVFKKNKIISLSENASHQRDISLTPAFEKELLESGEGCFILEK